MAEHQPVASMRLHNFFGSMESFSAEDSCKEGESNGDSAEGRQSEEGGEKEGTVVDMLLRYTQETSIHGVKYVFDSSRGWLFRIVWGVLDLLGVGFLLKLLSDLFESYLQFKVNTAITVTPTDHLPFPAVTICNLNSMELSKLQAQDTAQVNVSAAIIALTMMTSLFKNHVNYTVETVEQNIPPELLNRTFQNISRAAFPDLSSTLISCFWDGREERCQDMFVPLDLGLRRCFQFNTRPPRRVSYSGGMSSGLQVIVDVRQSEYLYTSEALSVGAKVILHEPREVPDIVSKGFLVPPGFNVLGKTTVRKYNYLPDPFKAYGKETCVVKEEEDRDNPNTTVYSSALCRIMCMTAWKQKMCHCRLSDGFLADNFDLPLCTVKDVYTCYFLNLENITQQMDSTGCPCPRRCRRTEYEVGISNAFFPSDATLEMFQSLNVTETKEARKNIFSLNIFFDDLVSNEIRHEPKHTLDSIMGTVGGQMGLFIGASLLSLAELMCLLLSLGRRAARALCFKKCAGPHSSDRAKS